MCTSLRSDRGFSLIELMMTVAVAAIVLAIGVPILTDLTESTKLNGATREVERELQSARLKAVSTNRTLRVRFNCPAEGFFRTVEFLNSAADTATNRCLETAYPYRPDNDVMTRPNSDGPIRVLPDGATVTDAIIEFRPDGTARAVVANVAQNIVNPVTLTVTRKSKSRMVTVNGIGKVELQQTQQ